MLIKVYAATTHSWEIVREVVIKAYNNPAHLSDRASCDSQSGQMAKKPPKIRLDKERLFFMPATVWQIFHTKRARLQCNDRKRKLCQSAETCFGKSSWNYCLQVNLFSACFSNLELLCDLRVSATVLSPISTIWVKCIVSPI